MRIYSLFRATALVLVAASLMPVATAGLVRRDNGVPVVFSISPSSVYAGQTVYIDVILSHATSTDQVVNISTVTAANWNALPCQVVVLAGHSDVAFYATVSSSASGVLQATASCNGGSASQIVPLANR